MKIRFDVVCPSSAALNILLALLEVLFIYDTVYRFPVACKPLRLSEVSPAQFHRISDRPGGESGNPTVRVRTEAVISSGLDSSLSAASRQQHQDDDSHNRADVDPQRYGFAFSVLPRFTGNLPNTG